MRFRPATVGDVGELVVIYSSYRARSDELASASLLVEFEVKSAATWQLHSLGSIGCPQLSFARSLAESRAIPLFARHGTWHRGISQASNAKGIIDRRGAYLAP